MTDHSPLALAAAAAFFLPAPAAWATQGHGGPEGLYVHQMAHLFFLAGMGLLIFWLRRRRLVASPGWRFIQYACLLFMLWNADAFAVHWLEEQTQLISISRISEWRLLIQTRPGFEWLGAVYYIVKLDHLLCVPALFFLYRGLKRLPAESKGEFTLDDTEGGP